MGSSLSTIYSMDLCYYKCFGKPKILINKNKLINDIMEVNKITNSKNFEIRCGLKIHFEIVRRNKIYCGFFKLSEERNAKGEIEKTRTNMHEIIINPTKFYQFKETIINSCIIHDSPSPRPTTNTPQDEHNDSQSENEANICEICFERKNNILLKCLHTFCEVCIKIWLFEKDMHCPLCKQDPDLSYDSKDNLTLVNRKWSIIEKKEIETDEYKDYLDEMLVQSITKLIS